MLVNEVAFVVSSIYWDNNFLDGVAKFQTVLLRLQSPRV